MAKGFNYVSAQDYHGLRAACLIVLFWVAVWNLTEEAIMWLETKYGYKRTHLYVVLLILVIGFIIFDPYTFEGLVD
jgi:hypothetical protein